MKTFEPSNLVSTVTQYFFDVIRRYFEGTTDSTYFEVLSRKSCLRSLNLDQKRIQVNIYKALLKWFKWSVFVPMNLGYTTTLLRRRNSQNSGLIAKGEPAPKKVKIVSSVSKVMAAFFWHSHGIFIHHFSWKRLKRV